MVTSDLAEEARLPLLQQGVALRVKQPTGDGVAAAMMPLVVSDATE